MENGKLLAVSDRLDEALRRMCRASFNIKVFILENMKSKGRQYTKISRIKNKSVGWEVVSHPQYSTIIELRDFHLFQSLERFISIRTFKIKDVENNFESFARKIPDFFLKTVLL